MTADLYLCGQLHDGKPFGGITENGAYTLGWHLNRYNLCGKPTISCSVWQVIPETVGLTPAHTTGSMDNVWDIWHVRHKHLETKECSEKRSVIFYYNQCDNVMRFQLPLLSSVLTARYAW